MNHKMLRPFIVKVSVLGYFPPEIIYLKKILSLKQYTITDFFIYI